MKLAVSNIAWPAELDATVYAMLAAGGIGAIEVAPTRIWPHWQGITVGAMREFRHTVEQTGLRISSLQSILFQKPELRLFGSPQVREALYQHLCVCADIAVELGAESVVFGAPRNRNRGEVSEDDAFAIATEFFTRSGAYYAQHGVCLAFEANPTHYDCDFATSAGTAARLVRAAGSKGFRLHLDTACMHLAGDEAVSVIGTNADILCHFHVSEPFLGTFHAPQVAHREIATALESRPQWAALEMRPVDPPLPALEEALRFLKETYGDS